MKKIQLFSLIITLVAASTMILNAQCSQSKSSSNYGKTTNDGHQNIVDIAVGSEVHTTLVAAVKAAGLVSTLQGDGPFTVFAPTNKAFGKLPSGTVETLLKPENKSTLTGILTYHVVPANLTADSVINGIKASGGKFKMKTVNGQSLTAMFSGNNVVLKDQAGNKSVITATDLAGSNGVIHVIDTVVMPH